MGTSSEAFKNAESKIELTTILVILLAISTATTLVVLSDEADAVDNKANDTGYFS